MVYHTGCPAQAKAMPPQVAETITTTRSDINLQIYSIFNNFNQPTSNAGYKFNIIQKTKN